MPIEPHGGTLINRIVDGETKNKLEQKARGLEQITINSREISDVEIIATYRLANINRVKLEKLIHKFFESAKLEIEIIDRFGKPVKVREWFLVPVSAGRNRPGR